MSPPTAGAVLLIYGNHRLLVEDELKKVQSRIADAGEADFNLDVFEAGTGPIEDALQAAETLPFGSDRRYVIVKEAQNLGAAEVKKLARYLENPSDTSALILAAVDLKSNSSLVKVVEKGGRVREVNKRRDQVPGWIRGRFKERGLKVSGKAIAYLQEALGEDLMAIERAVEKVVNLLDRESNTRTGVFIGPDDLWALCLVHYVGTMIVRSAPSNLGEFIERFGLPQ